MCVARASRLSALAVASLRTRLAGHNVCALCDDDTDSLSARVIFCLCDFVCVCIAGVESNSGCLGELHHVWGEGGLVAIVKKAT